jgi:hypothetical protein
MPRFVPKNWIVREKDILWAIEEFKVTRQEVLRQIELMRDHEFKRSYTCFDRVFRNWMRKAEEIEALKRERKPREAPGELTVEERAADIKKWEEDMKRLRVVK